MNWKLMVGTLCVAVSTAAFAEEKMMLTYEDKGDDSTVSTNQETYLDWKSYKGNEFNVSLFGSGTVGRRDLERASTHRFRRDGRLGLGVGASYFFSRYVGLEGYAYSESTGGNFVDNVDGNLIARLPILRSGVALYGFGGGGRQFDPKTQWTLDAGAGVEWRFLDHVGIFADARYVWADKTRDYGLGRVGLRFGF